ncbi:MAG: radical SAM protein [Variibacter sp.]|nr:radical SAM protein [Variibacter sp.]
MPQQNRRRRFCLVLVKPTHYCDEGYPIQWLRSAIPSNSLACVYGIARQCAEEKVLGEDVDIDIHPFDETNTRIRPERLARLIEAADGGMVMLIGVQSNQVPRALDIARPLRRRGIQVGIGGFHMSGVIAMIDGEDAALKEAQAMGVSVFAGEAEGRLHEVLRDAWAGTLKPLYNFMNDLPAIEGAPVPILSAVRVKRTAGAVTSFDAGRGCPYQCSFCTIINVQGRKSRRRSPDDIEKIVRENLAQGLRRFFITDDNFARNKDWEIILDRLIRLREVEGLQFSIIIQVDTLCHRLPNFIDKCRRAGVRRVFIGLENINPANLAAAKKKQNKITEYRKMLLAWKQAGIVVYAGYILGFPGDTVESILHDVEIIKRELPIDLLEFFYLTPLPGSEDHQKLFRARVPMDADLNRYDLYHITADHPRMSREEWAYAYKMAWKTYYTMEHMETVLRRAVATRASGGNTAFLLTWFKGCIDIENVHPLEGGFVRLKFRRDRRPTLPIEPVWTFYPRYWLETLVKNYRWGKLYLQLRRIYLGIKKDPRRYEYTDLALTPVDDETETLELFKGDAAHAYVDQERRLERARKGEGSGNDAKAPMIAAE